MIGELVGLLIISMPVLIFFAISKFDSAPTESEIRKSYSTYNKGGWTRYEAFSQILHDHPPRDDYREGDIVVLSVLFEPFNS